MAGTDDVLTNLVGRQRKRLIATVLGHAEREVYGSLTQRQQEAFRSKVLEAAGVFSDFVLDLVRASNEGAYVNKEAMRVLYLINNNVRELLEEDDEDFDDEDQPRGV